MKRNRVLIENVIPEINGGRYFIKRTVGGGVVVSADIFADGFDSIRANLLFKHETEKEWMEIEMEPVGNDRWKGRFVTDKAGFYSYKIHGWVDHLKTWHEDFKRKLHSGKPLEVELEIGKKLIEKAALQYGSKESARLKKFAERLNGGINFENAIQAVLGEEFADLVSRHPLKKDVTEYDKKLRVRVGNHKGLFSTWYQLFPRSASGSADRHGTFRDVERLLPRISQLGFDILYFPPIHPIGTTSRKGKNNLPEVKPGEPGSPWAIGNAEGGHYHIHPELGTFDDYENLIKKARSMGISIAFDLAFQCSHDHPWVKEHPEWFSWRPDGTIAHSESPPYEYTDVVPLDFETEDWENLWNELKKVTLFWVEKGIEVFRVAIPHTKPVRFWEWLISEVHKVNPDVIFLAAAFTSPKMIAVLSKVGFTQSYTYFIWKNTRQEIEEYMQELTGPELRQYFRPSFWPNVPDVLPYSLMSGNSNVYALRLLLAATLSSSYGIYGPAFELMDNQGNTNGKEEYLNSEKYEIKEWNWEQQNRLTYLIARINTLRRENEALQSTFNIHFTSSDNEEVLSYVKTNDDGTNIIWCIVSFDTEHTQSGYVQVPKQILGLGRRVNIRVTDLLTQQTYHWFNDWNYIELNPDQFPMHILKVEVIKNMSFE